MLLATVNCQEKQYEYEPCEDSEDVPGYDVVSTKVETRQLLWDAFHTGAFVQVVGNGFQ